VSESLLVGVMSPLASMQVFITNDWASFQPNQPSTYCNASKETGSVATRWVSVDRTRCLPSSASHLLSGGGSLTANISAPFGSLYVVIWSTEPVPLSSSIKTQWLELAWSNTSSLPPLSCDIKGTDFATSLLGNTFGSIRTSNEGIVLCRRDCSGTMGNVSAVQGNAVYADSSSVCAAARHVGTMNEDYIAI
jgi:hypothetical protein